MTLQDIQEFIKNTESKDTRLYFITRIEEAKRSRIRAANKTHVFKVYQIDFNQELQESLFNATLSYLEQIAKKNYDVVDYDVLSDETEHLFTYSVSNKIESFADVVTNQLLQSAPKVTSLKILSSGDEQMWAYCLSFSSSDGKEKMFSFRKILPNKVGINEKSSFLKAVFNARSLQLALQKEETISLDEQVDCIYFMDTFFVLKKGNFERIVGLQEENKEKAKVIVGKLLSSNMLIGGEHLNQLVENKPSVHKKLIKIEKIGYYERLDFKAIKKMTRISKQHGVALKVQDDKLILENEEDVDALLKVLGDYYKKGEVSGKSYGTFSGKELQAGQK